MDRLAEKMAAAALVVPNQTKALEADADKLIARGADFAARRAKSFNAQHAILDSGEKGMDALDAQLALLSNDPLPSSGGSQEDAGEPSVTPLPEVQLMPASSPPPVVNGVNLVGPAFGGSRS